MIFLIKDRLRMNAKQFDCQAFDIGSTLEKEVAHGAPRLGQSVSNLAQRLPATSYFTCYHFLAS